MSTRTTISDGPWQIHNRTVINSRRFCRAFGDAYDFEIDERYDLYKVLGQGAYGVVVAAIDPNSAERRPGDRPGEEKWTYESIAIKKVTNVFSKKILAKRALREIKLLQHFRGHRNITCLYDMDIIDPNNFNEVYLYEELMECDLAAIIRSGQPLTNQHYQSFVYQILCGLKYIHSANVLHRDLKPGNLLVNADCELKICDFGLARGFSVDPQENAGYMTEYVATRWYRAPEIMLSFQSYTKAIDVWSVGCILAELLGGRPFFKGRDYVDQLNQILHILGSPDEETLQRIGSLRAREYVRNLPRMYKKTWSNLFGLPPYPGVERMHGWTDEQYAATVEISNNDHEEFHKAALDLLDKLLTFDPTRRIDVDTALAHKFLCKWHEPNDEPECEIPFNFDFEVVEDVAEMKKMMVAEVQRFRNLVRGGTNAPYPKSQAMPHINPEQADRSANTDEPRPQEFQQQQTGDGEDDRAAALEDVLAGGLDAMRKR